MQELKRPLLHAALLSLVIVAGLSAAETPVATPVATPIAVTTKPDPSVVTNLIFDADVKQYDAKLAEISAPFKFEVTNTWTNELTVDKVQTSCGCTVASLPSNPWHIAPGTGGEVDAKINLIGKPPGLVTKTLTFHISVNGVFAGTPVATLKVTIPSPQQTGPSPLSAADRNAAMEKAKSDARTIFTDPKCAECHVNQGHGLMGAKLYAADCGICHESPNRESSVPDLHALKVPTNLEYWKAIITSGKPHTMMPAFSVSQGGPLNDEQILSVAGFLDRTISHHFRAVQAMTNAAATPTIHVGQ